jgi:hypothetical protein
MFPIISPNLNVLKPSGFPSVKSNLDIYSWPPGNDILDGLVLKYDFSDRFSYPGASNVLNDLNGGRYNGRIFNNPVFENNGRFDSLNFRTGTSQHIVFPIAGLPSGAEPRTLSVWFRTNNLNTQGWAFTYGRAIALRSFTIGSFNNLLLIGYYDGSVVSPIRAVANVWYNLTATYIGTRLTLYVNGVFSNSGNFTLNTDTNPSTAFAYMGRQVNGAEFMDGNVTKVLLYNRALSDSEVFQLFKANNWRYGL